MTEQSKVYIRSAGDRLLLLRDPVGNRIEMEATIQFDSADKVGKAGAMIVLGYRWIHDAYWFGVTFWPTTQTVTVGGGWTRTNTRVGPEFENGSLHVNVVCYDDHLIVRAGDRLIYDGKTPVPSDWVPGDMIGFASVDGQGAMVRFSGLRIRQLKHPPGEK